MTVESGLPLPDRSESELPLEPFYQSRPGGLDPSLPGEPPYTRGLRPEGYRGRLWTMRQYAGFGSAESTNERFRYLLERGQTGLSVAFDL
ncbi:Methylmalonyl-CoA mutase, alpha and beta chain, catalytic domain protein, partial [mine drainage metagenome]